MYAVKYGSDIYVADSRAELRANETVANILNLRNFMGTPLTHIEPADLGGLSLMASSGCRIHWLTPASS